MEQQGGVAAVVAEGGAEDAQSVEELKAEIEEVRQQVNRDKAGYAEQQRQLELAEERQRLRRVLDLEKETSIDWVQSATELEDERKAVDEDRTGPYCEGTTRTDGRKLVMPQQNSGEVQDYGANITKKEYTWTIHGMSWLNMSLERRGHGCAQSEPFTISKSFGLLYNPAGGNLAYTSDYSNGDFFYNSSFVDKSQNNFMGSLAFTCENIINLVMRYSFFIKRKDGEFIQWGRTTNHVQHSCCQVAAPMFGPDVHKEGQSHGPVGVFGLSHEELIDSEWVQDDSFTIKLVVEVKSKSWPTRDKIPLIGEQTPKPTFGKEFLALLQDGRHTDITFVVQGKELRAHSLVLMARSAVFEKELSCGMRESEERRVIVDDIDTATFQAMLEFIYTDDFEAVEKMVVEARAATDDGGGDSQGGGLDGRQGKQVDAKAGAGGGGAYESEASFTKKRIALLQSLLQAAHRYQIARLQAWCELQLCNCIVVEEACSVLTQAHLFEAVDLEQACLRFIKAHFDKVVMTASFGVMTQEWPEVALRISMFMAGLAPGTACAALEAQKKVRQQQQQCVELDSSSQLSSGSKRKRGPDA
jgi:speckle-type POZ protein